MSIDTCKMCGQYVDTDNDCDAYCQPLSDGTDKPLDNCRCERCRERVCEENDALEATRPARMLALLQQIEPLLGVDCRGQDASENIAELKSDIQQLLREIK